MVRFKRTKSTRSAGSKTAAKGRRRIQLNKAVDLILIVAAAVAVVYIVGVAGSIASGYSAEEPTPRYTIRLQLVDATRPSDSVRVSAAEIEALSDLELAIEVVERSRFDFRPIDHSQVISRVEDLSGAKILAERLGLATGDIEFRPLANNVKHLTATLILGVSGIQPVVKVESEKEI